ncbi:hypothetical protein AKJ44_02280 [candidate division MSBL1 archaeon SCGC-AAA261F17]|uniref:Uncharacterized protein n=1 Tax=candidate division MSBL1 archaeon SCGC-AAA261F17 TaxID=1698274 RepID=A0A133V5F9_9EURY|nr:hypothetical protein AKJ44_02280 [candidate division MSBL1 archaeon SCGC-AAA261F17]
MNDKEVKRRQLAAVAREAGTSIRKKMIERQALSADLNLPLAEKVKEKIDECLQPLQKLENMSEKPVGEAIMDTIDTIIGFFNWSMKAEECVDQTNQLIKVTNNRQTIF